MSSLPLAGRHALVTGAAIRTGRGIALALARAGADLVLHYLTSEQQAKATASEIREIGRRVATVRGDLTKADQAERVVREAEEAFGHLDVVVNNVGFIVWKDLHDLSPEEWRESIDGTLGATYHVCRAALPGMRERGFGRIVNILDVDADAIAPVLHATPYKIGKTGSLILTKTLATSEAPYGITVNAVSPGSLDNTQQKVSVERIPAGREGSVEDVAHAVLFFVSPGAEYVTGANLKVSGGYLL